MGIRNSELGIKTIGDCHYGNRKSGIGQFKALLLKEYWTHKRYLWLPGIISLGIYIVFLLLKLVAHLGVFGEDVVLIGEFNIIEGVEDSSGYIQRMMSMFNFVTGAVVAIVATVIVFFNYCGLTASMLNDDFKHKCAVFHSTFPVSFMRRILAKFAIIVVTMPIQIIVFALLNMLLVQIIATHDYGYNQYFLFMGILQGTIMMIFMSFFYISIAWLFSAMYKEKTFSKTFNTYFFTTGGLVGLSYLLGFNEVMRKFFIFVVRLFSFDLTTTNTDAWQHGCAQTILMNNWGNIFSLDMLLRVLLMVIFFGLGYLILSKREVL